MQDRDATISLTSRSVNSTAMKDLAGAQWDISGRRLIALLVLLIVLAAMYYFLVDGGDTFRMRPGWTTVTLANCCAWVCYSAVLWSNRRRLVRLDYHMLYLPATLWFVSDIVVRVVTPFLVESPSKQKGLTNLFFEGALVALLYGVYLLRLVCRPPSVQWTLILGRVVLILAAATAFFVPPLGE